MKLTKRTDLLEGDYILEMYESRMNPSKTTSSKRNWCSIIGRMVSTGDRTFVPLWYMTDYKPDFDNSGSTYSTYTKFTYYVLTEEEVMEHVVLETI
jgi:hypothetical protein